MQRCADVNMQNYEGMQMRRYKDKLYTEWKWIAEQLHVITVTGIHTLVPKVSLAQHPKTIITYSLLVQSNLCKNLLTLATIGEQVWTAMLVYTHQRS